MLGKRTKEFKRSELQIGIRLLLTRLILWSLSTEVLMQGKPLARNRQASGPPVGAGGRFAGPAAHTPDGQESNVHKRAYRVSRFLASKPASIESPLGLGSARPWALALGP